MDQLPFSERRRLGETIRHYRQENDISQSGLAEAAGLTRGYVSQLENGNHSPSLHTIRQISLGLDMDLHELIRDAAL